MKKQVNASKKDGIFPAREDMIHADDGYLAFLLGISDLMRSLSDPQEILREACSLLGEFLEASRVVYVDIAGDDFITQPGYVNGVAPFAERGKLASFGRQLMNDYSHGEVIVADDVFADERFTVTELAVYKNTGIAAFISVMLVKNGKWIGMFSVHQAQPRGWTRAEQILLKEVAERLWTFLEHARTEAALRESEEKYRLLLEQEVDDRTIELRESKSLLEGVFNSSFSTILVLKAVYDHQGIIVDFVILMLNRNGINTLGKDPTGYFYMEVFKGAAYSSIFARFQEVMHTGKPADFEEYYESGGENGWYHISVVQLDGLLVVTSDNISERKKAELQLKESRDLLQSIFDSSLSIISVMNAVRDEQGEIVDFRYVLSNYSRDGQPNRHAGKLYTQVHAAVKELGIFQRFKDVVDTGISADFDLHYQANDFDTWFHVVAQKLGDGFVAISQDISLRRKAEEKIKEQSYFIQQVTEMVPDIIIVTEVPSLRLVYNNKDSLGFLGYDDVQVHNLDINERLKLVHPDDLPLVHEFYGAFALPSVHDDDIVTAEYRVINSSGGWYWLSIRGKVFERKPDGSVRSIVSVVQNITERREAEEKERKNRIRLQHTEEMLKQKDEFISIASHELKTPVTSIKIYAETMQELFEQSGDDANFVMMQKLNAQVNRLTELVRDLLDTTRISEGRLPLSTEEFSLGTLVAERVEELQRITQKHRLVLKLQPVPPIVADRERIGQVLTNLISNAIKYTPDEGDIIISMEADGLYAKVSIRDHGVGIPADVQDKVFDRFFRVSSSRMQTFPGMGLGLYISAGIVRRHNGTIGVESTEGKGSLFHFSLPLNNGTA